MSKSKTVVIRLKKASAFKWSVDQLFKCRYNLNSLSGCLRSAANKGIILATHIGHMSGKTISSNN